MGSISQSDGVFHPVKVLVIGAGSRGTAYSRAITHLAKTGETKTCIAAVAEPDPYKRSDFGRQFIWSATGKPGYGESFTGWEEWLDWEKSRRASCSSGESVTPADYTPISAVLICTLDSTHHPILTAIAPLNLHVLCEKPLALSLAHCLDIPRSITSSGQSPKIFSIGHVLRYSPHNILLHRLVCTDLAIGEIVSIEHTEPVGWWHFAHSYVRGNWRRETPEGVGSLLTKSCHDVDFLMWMMSSPSLLTGNSTHEPSTVYSTGSLTHFRRSKKPKEAGEDTTNCVSCPLRDEGCLFSAKQIYVDRFLKKGHTGWPVKIVCPDIEDVVQAHGLEAAEKHLLSQLSQDYDRKHTPDESIAQRSWYGRCVYESDNDVVDEQTVVISWDESPRVAAGPPEADRRTTTDPSLGRGRKTAILHMTYPTASQCERRGRIYGTLGEITYDSSSITLHTFATGQTQTFHPNKDIEVGEGHGGGDFGLAGNFVRAVEAVELGGMDVPDAQRRWVGCDLDEVVRSHQVVFAAERSRQTGQVIRLDEGGGGGFDLK